MKAPRMIAEVGCNHMGDMEIAKEMIVTAAIFCKVDAVKFQKRNNKELLTEEQYNAPHPNPHNSYGNTYGEHREYLEFDVDQHKQLKQWCEEAGLVYSTSVWDLTSAKEIASIKPSFIKIPSALNLHYDMLGYLCEEYEGEIHMSLGMTAKSEEADIIDFFVKNKRAKDVVLYSCTSGYPVPFEDVCLFEISRLQKLYGNVVKEIGFSGHHNGIAVDIAAYALGATTIERHYTLNRTWKGTDHAASLEPDGMRRLARDLKAVQKSLTYKETDMLDIELVQRDKLKWKNH
ncbi:N-acetylneuraminate synthase family protein [Paenibacillus spongiae]|uniref:N-acetylneuraminate synthase family protein n=1 Tax=Paenibacillus spongiae TaxID=2909671 RepID=A0ABY5S8H8_9BACL|nr:N-acetylneuraminate synthase family protein [Paenibacillus spongiae]UVI29885.1 N-acetylneuraminate synthase family protein [Paenibacillus spongiae]